MITNPTSGTNVHEIAPGIYRINTPIAFPDGAGAFNFNQYLIVDDETLVFHTGPRRMSAARATTSLPQRRKLCRSAAGSPLWCL